jgi:protein ImuA
MTQSSIGRQSRHDSVAGRNNSALAQARPVPDRVIYVEAGDEKSVLICFEEGLRHGGLGAVVAEVVRLSMMASRRLQLAGRAKSRRRKSNLGEEVGSPQA